MSVYTIKSGDFGFLIRAELSDEAGIPNLAGATVRFKMRPAPESDSPADPINIVADIVDSAKGIVSYLWQDGDTDIPGVYRSEWEVTFADGGVETFPSDDYNSVVIRADLD